MQEEMSLLVLSQQSAYHVLYGLIGSVLAFSYQLSHQTEEEA